MLTKFHEDWTINVTPRVLTMKTSSPPCGQQDVLTNLNEDWTIKVTSRELTRKTAPLHGGHFHEDWTVHVTSRVLTSFRTRPRYQDIIGTNLLTKFHEDQTTNVASRVLTRQNVDDVRRTTHGGQKVIPKAHHEHVVLRLAKNSTCSCNFYA
ncbi:hypothetical protein DPMN_091286 [Dreissena polymorpha]|uniref:Uncharacterized protein n=1 Tax=Dreissena polymorpha TaxID=45954 RepID=A0A9D4KZ99_DREPO|nr:hypothetical protein DPMN_091286 [Dreissena polymorpha]